MTRLRRLLATWFGAGLVPHVPGTVGTLAALPLVVLLWFAAPVWGCLAAAGALTLIGLWAAGGAEELFGSRDPEAIVIDEVVGMLVAAALLPLSPGALFLAFVLFRFFDMVKPWPLPLLGRAPGSLGIMLDDLAAGFLANAGVRVSLFVLETSS